MSVLGDRIKNHRELRGWKQEELAPLVGRTKGTISHWEIGKHDPSLAEVKKLAEIFDTTVAELIGEVPMFEEPRANYIMVKKDDLINLQKKALEMEGERIKDLEDQLGKALGTEDNEADPESDKENDD